MLRSNGAASSQVTTLACSPEADAATATGASTPVGSWAEGFDAGDVLVFGGDDFWRGFWTPPFFLLFRKVSRDGCFIRSSLPPSPRPWL